MVALFAVALPAVGVLPSGQATVIESARSVPVAYEADVIVVGGSTGAVAAAVAAAEAGASVFLAAPYPYLGDDMTATLRLWLEEGETPVAPLAKRIFSDPLRDPRRLDLRPRFDFTYRASLPSAARHRDTDPPARLHDGKFANSRTESVQYDGNVSINLDLGESANLQEVRVYAFERPTARGNDGFGVERVDVFSSQDVAGKEDTRLEKIVATMKKTTGEAGPDGRPVLFRIPLERAQTTRFLRLDVAKAAGVGRILLGEIEVVGSRSRRDDNPSDRPAPPMPRPMHVKKTLDEALLHSGVTFLYSCYLTDVLRDSAGNVCGIVMANRAGRQAVVAKVVIDATEEAAVARLAGAAFRRRTGGERLADGNLLFRHTVIGGEPVEGPGISHRIIDPPFAKNYHRPFVDQGSVFHVIEYTLRLPLDGSAFDGRNRGSALAAMAAAEQAARRMTYHPAQQFTSDELSFVREQAIVGETSLAKDADAATPPLGACRPRGVGRVLVAGPAADVPRDVAERLVRPLARIDLGSRLGRAAADESKTLPSPAGVRVAVGKPATAASEHDVAETLVGVRPTERPKTVPQAARELPVLGRYDVVVIGGGTSGAPAGIAAACAGARTLVIEYLHGLGGVGTLGAIAKYYHGNRVGFTSQIAGDANWAIEPRMEWYRRELEKAEADVWFGAIGCGAVVDKADGQTRVCGAVVATPEGRGVVWAKVVIDATGNADVAAAAGAPCQYIDETELAIQGTGLPPRHLGAGYTNTDFTYSDETDMVDVWRMFVHGKDKYPDAFDQGNLVDTRERRRIVGDATIAVVDQVNGRTYPDSIVLARSNFDSHGYTVDPYFLLEHPGRRSIDSYVPYRCLLPQGVEGLLVVGIAMSVHRDALPVTRMQPDIQNQGYAAGRAAAMAAAEDVSLRRIDVKRLQEHLVEIGNLPRRVLTDNDSYPLADRRIAEAVEAIRDGKRGAAVILAHRDRALPLVKASCRRAKHEGHPSELAYAKVLCVLGDGEAVDTVLDAVRSQPQWDAGWNFRGMGQFGAALSPLDTLIVALGLAGEKKAVPAIVDKLELLTAADAFSHHRAAAMALELLRDPRAAEPLARLLAKPGMRGYAQTSIDRVRSLDPTDDVGAGENAVVDRRVSLRELAIARALLRCGDHKGVGREILTQYTQDLRGHLARHATAVLESAPRAMK